MIDLLAKSASLPITASGRGLRNSTRRRFDLSPPGSGWCAFLTLLALAIPMRSSAKPKSRVMVLDLPADSHLAPNVTQTLNEFLAGALRDQGFEVLSAADVGAALGLEKQKQLLGCTESSCMAEIGGAMGVDYIVRGSLALLDENTALTLVLVQTNAKVVNQVRATVAGHSSSALLAALEAEVPKLVAPIKPVVRAPADLRPAPLTVAHTESASSLELGTPQPGMSSSRKVAIVTGIVGILAVAAGTYFTVKAHGSYSDLRDMVDGRVLASDDRIDSTRSAVRSQQTGAIAGFAGGGAVLAIATGLWIWNGGADSTP